MRANEFLREADAEGQGSFTMPSGEPVTITVPVTINMPADAGPESGVENPEGPKVNTTIAQPGDAANLPEVPIWIPPGQQSLELQKQQGGKESPVINQIVKSDNGPESDPSDGVFANVSGEGDADPEQSVYAAGALDSGWDDSDEDEQDAKMAGTGEEPQPEGSDDRLIDLIRKLARI